MSKNALRLCELAAKPHNLAQSFPRAECMFVVSQSVSRSVPFSPWEFHCKCVSEDCIVFRGSTFSPCVFPRLNSGCGSVTVERGHPSPRRCRSGQYSRRIAMLEATKMTFMQHYFLKIHWLSHQFDFVQTLTRSASALSDVQVRRRRKRRGGGTDMTALQQSRDTYIITKPHSISAIRVHSTPTTTFLGWQIRCKNLEHSHAHTKRDLSKISRN